jgi:lysophospholipase L1-like esterase
LAQFAAAIKAIALYEHYDVVDLYNQKELMIKNLVKFKRLKDPKTGGYKNFPYPDFIHIPFNPETDEYPYPKAAMNMTYDGLHPSDKGYTVIANDLLRVMKKYSFQ